MMSPEEIEQGRKRRARTMGKIAALALFPLLIGLVLLAKSGGGLYETDKAAPNRQTPQGPATVSKSAKAKLDPKPEAQPVVPPKPADAAAAAPAPAPPEPVAKPRLELIFPGEFQVRRDVPKYIPKEQINAFIEKVGACVGRIEVLGHTDQTGSEKKNLLLGMKRADHVRNLLITGGVDPSRLFTSTKGARAPVIEGGTEIPETLNRRVTVECEAAPTDGPR